MIIIIIINNKAKVVTSASLCFFQKRGGICNTFHELLSEKWIVKRSRLYYPNQQQYSQHPILWVVLSISVIILRTRLIRVQSQHRMKQVGLTINSKTFLVRNSDNIKHKTLKPCNESLKSTDLRFRPIGSLKADESQLPQSLIA